MENLAPSRNSLLPMPRYMLPSVSDLVVEIRAKSLSEFNTKSPGGIVFQFMPTLYHDHENFGKSTTIFIQNLKKTPVILRVNKHFWGRFCVSVLFNNCFPFSLKTLVKYNTDLLVVNKVAKIP